MKIEFAAGTRIVEGGRIQTGDKPMPQIISRSIHGTFEPSFNSQFAGEFGTDRSVCHLNGTGSRYGVRHKLHRLVLRCVKTEALSCEDQPQSEKPQNFKITSHKITVL